MTSGGRTSGGRTSGGRTSGGRTSGGRTGAGRHLLLVGMMGTGKTTIGRLLAGQLDRPFLDVDSQIEARAGQTVTGLFATLGEKGFRSLEREVLASLLASPEPAVVACGGGTVLDRDNRELLRESGLVVWLRAEPTELARRLGAGALARRPLLAGPEPAAEALGRLEGERRAAYAETAHLTLETDGRSISGLVREIAAAMARPLDQPLPFDRSRPAAQ